MKARYVILAIVEGHGEERAVPALLRRWFKSRRFHNFETPDLAIRAPGSGALKCAHEAEEDLGIESYIEIAAAQRPDGILVLLDADDECFVRKAASRPGLGPELHRRAREVASHIPIEVVVANREYEAWFLAGLTALRQAGKVPVGQGVPRGSVETLRDCKGSLRGLLGRPYEETTDQPDLTGALPFTPGMCGRSPSYGKLMRALDALARAARLRRERG